MRLRAVLSVLVIALPLAGCVQHRTAIRSAPAPTLNDDAQHPGSTQGWSTRISTSVSVPPIARRRGLARPAGARSSIAKLHHAFHPA